MCRRFGLHPLQSFSKAGAAEQLDGAWGAVTAESDDARAVGWWLAETLGLRPFALADDDRAAYHAGAAMASNYLVTLRAAARSLLEAAGAPPEALDPLIRGVVDSGFELTGPIARGDWETVERHLAVIRAERPELEELYLVARRGDRPHRRPRAASTRVLEGDDVRVVRTIAEAREELAPLRAGTIGLVPTMGALHDGHLALLRAARDANETVVMSLFVNPTQFGDDADLARYPRDEGRDLARARECGVDLVFAPSADEMYPPGFQTWVDVTEVGSILEGRFRPGHFRGVATVVLKLLAIVRPTRVYFGQKDAQQVEVIRTMIATSRWTMVHIWTVDRHLVETVSRASAFTTRVSRPDMLVLGALVHDIGKGRGGDHSVIGAELATQIGNRLGLWPSDVELLSKVVRYHLLLPDTATRRDLQDPKTIASVVDALGGDPVLLELLHTLAEADSLATGPGVWGDWKASLIGDLVRRCRLVMSGEPLPQPDPIDPRYLSLASEVGVHVEMTPGDSPHIYNVTMIAPDRRGLLSKAAGVLALNSLRVHSASVNSHEGSAINTFVVSPHFGSPPAAELLRQQFILALDGELDVIASLQSRDRDAAHQGTTRAGRWLPRFRSTRCRRPRGCCGSTAPRRASWWFRSGPSTAPACSRC